MAQVPPSEHEPLHVPPQPLGVPQATPGGQFGTHTQLPLEQVSRGPLQGPLQRPPQPLGLPQAAPAGQFGAQTQLPFEQV